MKNSTKWVRKTGGTQLTSVTPCSQSCDSCSKSKAFLVCRAFYSNQKCHLCFTSRQRGKWRTAHSEWWMACNSNTFYVFNVSRTYCAFFTRLRGNYYFFFALSEIWNNLPVWFTEVKYYYYYTTLNSLSLFWLGESVQWIFKISACDVISADCTIIMSRSRVIGPLHDPVTWYKIIYTGEQVAQWDVQDKGRCIVLEVPLCNLLTSICNFVPCDRVVQRASSSRALYILPSVKKRNMTSIFFVQCIIKQLLDSVFVISIIIKVSVRVISLSLRLRLITPTSTLIIQDITKTSSNKCYYTL